MKRSAKGKLLLQLRLSAVDILPNLLLTSITVAHCVSKMHRTIST
ncbi:Putative casein kinase family protein [Zea mays]|uniref:Putative casein kinase family protein n=1 Tax=Zea mays TaxID=4577 RepID=A0A1D6ME30_MAIZE|nr:Putative casein kinase family protein [Zea mays]